MVNTTQVTGPIKLFVTFFLKVIMLNFTETEKDFLIKLLEGERNWYSNMARTNPGISIFIERRDKLTSILTKLGQHPFKTLLEKNSES